MEIVNTQRGWLEEAGRRRFPNEPCPISAVVSRLIRVCNNETNQVKRIIFKVVRCHNCSQSSTGGNKVTVELDLEDDHVTWLRNVQANCGHKSVDKTLRIMLDYYIGIFKSDSAIEDAILG